jgi:hypothetical protein
MHLLETSQINAAGCGYFASRGRFSGARKYETGAELAFNIPAMDCRGFANGCRQR